MGVPALNMLKHILTDPVPRRGGGTQLSFWYRCAARMGCKWGA